MCVCVCVWVCVCVCVFDGEEERQLASRRVSDKSCGCTGVRVCVSALYNFAVKCNEKSQDVRRPWKMEC